MTPQEFPFPDEPIQITLPDWFRVSDEQIETGVSIWRGIGEAHQAFIDRFAAGLGITEADFIAGTTIPNPIAVVAAGYRRATSSLAGMAIILALIAGAAYVAGKALS